MKRLPIWVVSCALFAIQYLLVAADVGFQKVGLDQALVPLMTLISVALTGYFSNSKDLGDLIAWCRGNQGLMLRWFTICLIFPFFMVWRSPSIEFSPLFAVVIFTLFASLIGVAYSIRDWILKKARTFYLWASKKLRSNFSADSSRRD